MSEHTCVLHRCLRLVAIPALLLPLGACFSYSTVPLEAIAADQQARFTLDQDGFGRVMNHAAIEGFPVQSMNLAGNRVSGRVAGVSADSLTIQLRGAGASILTTRISTRAIQDAAIRQFNRNNSIIAIGLGVSAAALMIQGGVIPGGGTESPDDNPENMIGFRLFSISVP